jgi:isopenicillin N synthase-like dioxygenase
LRADRFFVLVGHAIAPDLVRRTADTARAFFDLPYDEKMRIRRPAPEQNRGYNGVGQEALSYSIGRATPPDIKEFLSIGPVDVPDERYYRAPAAYPHFAPNLWPERPAALRPSWEAYWHRLNRACSAVYFRYANGFGSRSSSGLPTRQIWPDSMPPRRCCSTGRSCDRPSARVTACPPLSGVGTP